MQIVKKAALYVRVSTQEQNTELQRFELSRYAEARGFSVSEIFEEKASGRNVERAEFKRMIAAAHKREYDVLIVWKLDRFARSLKDLVNHLTQLTEVGIEFISFKDNIDMSTSAGRLMVHLLASFAEFEVSLTRERVCAGIANARRKGKVLGRPRRINTKKVLELRSLGLSLSKIANELKTTKSAVSKILKKAQTQVIETTK